MFFSTEWVSLMNGFAENDGTLEKVFVESVAKILSIYTFNVGCLFDHIFDNCLARV